MSQSNPDHDHELALAFLQSRINYERTAEIPYPEQAFKLDRMRELLARLGDPHLAPRVVHIAGTKGKGSTATMIAGALVASGYRTGLYTSPHLERLEERLAIDGGDCPPTRLVRLVQQVQPVVEAMDTESTSGAGSAAGLLPRLTYFEVTTALAMLYFSEERVDTAVLEVGLGGRLDSTNVCRPAVTTITTISFDHTRQLGNTLAAIAREKAGIIKPRVPVVTGVTAAEPWTEIERVALAHHAPVRQLDRDFSFALRTGVGSRFSENREEDCEEAPDTFSQTRLDFRDGVSARFPLLEDVSLRLSGPHQAFNAAVALATLNQLAERGWSFSEEAVRRGIHHARCPARVESFERAGRPLVVIDAAHNVASVAALVRTLDETLSRASDGPRRPRRLIFATSRDKDARGMLRLLLPCFDDVVLTRFAVNPRATDPHQLAQCAAELLSEISLPRPRRVQVTDSPLAAWSTATAGCSDRGLICVTGSFFIAAELRPLATQP